MYAIDVWRSWLIDMNSGARKGIYKAPINAHKLHEIADRCNRPIKVEQKADKVIITLLQ